MTRRHFLAWAAIAAISPFPANADDAAPSLKPGEVLRGAYVQERRLKGFNAPLKSEGQYTLALGSGLIWRAERPFEVVTVITSAGLIQQVSGSETMRLTAARAPFLARLYDLLGGALAGNWRALENDFTIARTGAEGRWTVVLTPRRAGELGMPFQTITIEGARFVDQVELLKPDGDADRLSFRDQTLSDEPLTSEEMKLLGALGR